MNQFFMHSWMPFGILGIGVLGLLGLLLGVVIIALKGYALWHAAKRNETGWFVAMLILNTMGILELVYLYFIVKKWNKPHHHEHHNHTEHHHSS